METRHKSGGFPQNLPASLQFAIRSSDPNLDIHFGSWVEIEKSSVSHVAYEIIAGSEAEVPIIELRFSDAASEKPKVMDCRDHITDYA